MEKGDIIRAIGRKVQVVERPSFRRKDLSAMRVGALRQMGKCIGVDMDLCVEKGDMVGAIVESGRVAILEDGEGEEGEEGEERSVGGAGGAGEAGGAGDEEKGSDGGEEKEGWGSGHQKKKK